MARVGTASVMSTLDLAKGYHQVPVASDSVEKTALLTPYRKYAYMRMPFQLKNAPAIFQQLMDEGLEPCREFSAPYLDDVVISLIHGRTT